MFSEATGDSSSFWPFAGAFSLLFASFQGNFRFSVHDKAQWDRKVKPRGPCAVPWGRTERRRRRGASGTAFPQLLHPEILRAPFQEPSPAIQTRKRLFRNPGTTHEPPARLVLWAPASLCLRRDPRAQATSPIPRKPPVSSLFIIPGTQKLTSCVGSHRHFSALMVAVQFAGGSARVRGFWPCTRQRAATPSWTSALFRDITEFPKA